MGPKFKGLTIAIMAFIVGTGVAYGLPHSTILSSANLKHDHASSKADGSDRDSRSEKAEPSESSDQESSSSGADVKRSSQGTHGAVVSAAAHCAVKGPAHGVLVSSVASRPDATQAQAVSACAAAKAAGESKAHGRSGQAHPSSHGKSDDEHGESTSDHGPKADPSKA